jgi:hypothetical protein
MENPVKKPLTCGASYKPPALPGDTYLRHGAYPDPNEIGIDYADILSRVTVAINIDIDKTAPIPTTIYDHVNLGYLTRHGMHRHHSVRPAWDYPGFFVGDATDLDDLVRFWNIRAADIRLHCVDPAHLPRYTATIPELGTAKRRHSAYSAMRAERRRSRFP